MKESRKPSQVKRFYTGHSWDDPRTAREQADAWKVGVLAAGHTTSTTFPHGDEHEVIVEVY